MRQFQNPAAASCIPVLRKKVCLNDGLNKKFTLLSPLQKKVKKPVEFGQKKQDFIFRKYRVSHLKLHKVIWLNDF